MIDDCECVRDVVRFLLRRTMVVRVMVAENSAEGLRLARRRKFDVVLSDINRWPGMNGLAFLRIFKHAHPTVPVIIVSGVMDNATARRAKWLRAFDCLAKPFDCRELVGMVRAAIASKRVCRTLLLSSRSRHSPLRSW